LPGPQPFGAGGIDNIRGGSGDDVIDVYDDFDSNASPDTVNCGSGAGDFVFYNDSDTLVNCENRSQRWFIIQGTPHGR
jgi:hypothetical protein